MESSKCGSNSIFTEIQSTGAIRNVNDDDQYAEVRSYQVEPSAKRAGREVKDDDDAIRNVNDDDQYAEVRSYQVEPSAKRAGREVEDDDDDGDDDRLNGLPKEALEMRSYQVEPSAKRAGRAVEDGDDGDDDRLNGLPKEALEVRNYQVEPSAKRAGREVDDDDDDGGLNGLPKEALEVRSYQVEPSADDDDSYDDDDDDDSYDDDDEGDDDDDSYDDDNDDGGLNGLPKEALKVRSYQVEPSAKRAGWQVEDDDDRLNGLPKEALLLILSLLDSKMAVLTCFFVLSKQWKDLWTELPNLRFNSASFMGSSSVKKFVLGFLSHRDTSKDLCKFNLTISGGSCFGNDKFLLQLVISLVTNGRGIRNLSICPSGKCSMPSYVYPMLFTWKSLRTLRLGNLEIPKDVSFDFPSLKGLYLVDCTLERDREDYDLFQGCSELETLWIDNCLFWNDVKRFVISAPKLETFTAVHIQDCYTFHRDFKMTITCPNLKSFTYEGRTFYDISFTCPDSIEELNVGVGSELFTYGMVDLKNMFNIFQQLGKAKFVTLTQDVMLVINRVPGFPRLRSPFTELRCLKIRTANEAPPYIVDYLIHRSPKAKVILMDDEVRKRLSLSEVNGLATVVECDNGL